MRPVVASLLLPLAVASAAEAGPDAARLASGMASAVEDGDSTARVKMTSPGAGVLQVRIKARRAADRTVTAYEVLWPEARKGDKIVLRQSGTGAPQGHAKSAAGDVSPLNAADLAKPLFGTALAQADAIENFFRWKNQKLDGEESVGKTDCLVLESRPGSGDASIYGKVRSWIDPRRMVAVRVEKYDKSGNLARRIETTRVAKDDQGRDVPAGMSVQAGGRTTEIEGANIRHDAGLTDADFAP